MLLSSLFRFSHVSKSICINEIYKGIDSDCVVLSEQQSINRVLHWRDISLAAFSSIYRAFVVLRKPINTANIVGIGLFIDDARVSANNFSIFSLEPTGRTRFGEPSTFFTFVRCLTSISFFLLLFYFLYCSHHFLLRIKRFYWTGCNSQIDDKTVCKKGCVATQLESITKRIRINENVIKVAFNA